MTTTEPTPPNEIPKNFPIENYFSGISPYERWLINDSAPAPIAYLKPTESQLFGQEQVNAEGQHIREITQPVSELFFNNKLLAEVSECVSQTLTTDQSLYIHGSLRDKIISQVGFPVKPIKRPNQSPLFCIADEALNDIDTIICASDAEFRALVNTLKTKYAQSDTYSVATNEEDPESETSGAIPQIRVYKKGTKEEILSISRAISAEGVSPAEQLRQQADTFFYHHQAVYLKMDFQQKKINAVHPTMPVTYPWKQLQINTNSSQYRGYQSLAQAIETSNPIVDDNIFDYLALQQAFRVFQHLGDGMSIATEEAKKVFGPLYKILTDPQDHVDPSTRLNAALQPGQHFMSKAAKKVAYDIAHAVQVADYDFSLCINPIVIPMLQVLFPNLNEILGEAAFNTIPNDKSPRVLSQLLTQPDPENTAQIESYNRLLIVSRFTDLVQRSQHAGFKDINQYLSTVLVGCYMADRITGKNTTEVSEFVDFYLKNNQWSILGKVKGVTYDNTPTDENNIPTFDCELKADSIKAMFEMAVKELESKDPKDTDKSLLEQLQNTYNIAGLPLQTDHAQKAIPPHLLQLLDSGVRIQNIIGILRTNDSTSQPIP